jgi:hypothetical protein
MPGQVKDPYRGGGNCVTCCDELPPPFNIAEIWNYPKMAVIRKTLTYAEEEVLKRQFSSILRRS